MEALGREATYLDDDDAVNNEEASNPTTLASHEQDTGVYHVSPSDHQTQPQDKAAVIPEESDEEPFNTTMDTTSDDSAINHNG